MTSRVRRAHLALANERAMEEEQERENPINPKELTHNHYEDSNRLEGSGATPSMGLSEYRGGNFATNYFFKGRGKLGRTKKEGGMTRRGGKFGSMMKPALARDKELKPGRDYAIPAMNHFIDMPQSEAHKMGQHLGQHLYSLHGGAFHQEFLHGLSGGAWYDFLDPHKNGVANAFDPNKNGLAQSVRDTGAKLNDFGAKVKNEFVNNDSALRQKFLNPTANQFTDPNSVLRGQVIPIGAQVAQYAQPFIDMAVPGAGTALNYGFKAANYANRGAKMLGYGTGAGMLEEPMPISGTNLSLSGGWTDPMTPERRAKSAQFKINYAKYKAQHGGANTGAYEGQGRRRTGGADKKASMALMNMKHSEDDVAHGANALLHMAHAPVAQPAQPAQLAVVRPRGRVPRPPPVHRPPPGLLPHPSLHAPPGVSQLGYAPPSLHMATMDGRGTGAGKGGRSARAQIVKKVMAEHGLKMIDASRFVKEHGLY